MHDEFLSRMVEEVKKMKVGDPLDRSTSHGPQNHKLGPTCHSIIELNILNSTKQMQQIEPNKLSNISSSTR